MHRADLAAGMGFQARSVWFPGCKSLETIAVQCINLDIQIRLMYYNIISQYIFSILIEYFIITNIHYNYI